MKYTSIWSSSPPLAPTFPGAAGGVAIFAKRPIAVRALRVPELQGCVGSGRLVIAKLVSGMLCALACIYGFPAFSPRHGENESFFRTMHSWAISLTILMLVAGGWNETVLSSQFLADRRSGLSYRAPNLPTTRSKQGSIAKSDALDQILVHHHFASPRRSTMEGGHLTTSQ